MRRFLYTFVNDCKVQWRNRLYHVGIIAAVITAIPLSQLFSPDQMHKAVAAVMLLVVGGTALLYTSAMIIFERDEGTLDAIVTSPLTITEYLVSKILSVTVVATMEAVVIIVLVMLVQPAPIQWPNMLIALIAIASVSVLFVLIGVILIVRHKKITNFLIPMSILATILQLPTLHFTGIYQNTYALIIPSSAPTMLMKGAYTPLSTDQWIYATGYTLIMFAILYHWAHRAFIRHIVEKAG